MEVITTVYIFEVMVLENIFITSDRWVRVSEGNNTIWFTGYVEVDGCYYDRTNIRDYFKTHNFRPSAVTEWRGEFAIVLKDESKIFAAVDRKRSIPLFYYRDDHDRWIVTDHLGRDLVNQNLNDTSVFEFIITGYVSNEKTLVKDILQLEPGQYLVIENNQVTVTSYFQFFHQVDESLDEASGVEELKKIFFRVFERLAKRIAGQSVMIPLSGGYDSRIIALLLKEFDVKPIRSFSYGKPGNQEAQISKEVADRLGIPWEFYTYSKADWFKWYHSEDWESYIEQASNLTSIGHLQDWPAVKQMKERYEDPFVFIPGHAGDFIAGSHIPLELTIDREFDLDEVVRQIMRKHHRLWDTPDHQVKSLIISEIKDSLQGFPFQNREQASAAFEYWDWKERQAKFITNSVRVYEFFGQDWQIPLWDDEIVDFFLKVPVELRYRKYLYDLTLHHMYPDYFPHPKKALSGSMFKWKQGPIHKILRRGYTTKLVFQQYFSDPMNWFGITGSYIDYLKETRFRYKNVHFSLPYNINSIIVKDYIESLIGQTK